VREPHHTTELRLFEEQGATRRAETVGQRKS